MLTYDITRRNTFDSLDSWHQEIISQSDPEVIIILVGNMKDKEASRTVEVAEAREFQKSRKIPFFLETSAKTGQNVETVF